MRLALEEPINFTQFTHVETTPQFSKKLKIPTHSKIKKPKNNPKIYLYQKIPL